jgi:anti-anti-sigma factor
VGVDYGIKTSTDDDGATVALSGEIDMQAAESVITAGQQALAAQPARLVIDLTATTFLDSGGIGAIVALRNSAIAGGAELVLRRGPRTVMRVLELVGLDSVIPTID